MKKLWVAIPFMLIVACSVKQSPPIPIVYTNDHWQDNQNAKLMGCYTKMATMAEVEACLVTLNVYI